MSLDPCWAVVWCLPLRFWWAAIRDWEINPTVAGRARFSEAGLKVLYISGEEASAQVRMRAQRLGLGSANVQLGADTNLRNILTTMDTEKPDLVIIDSIQTMWADTVESAPGSVSQVRSAAHELTTFAKRKGASVILVGHVTKEGQIAGPRVVEHMVDTVLYFEGERGHQFRILRAVKNRFGARTKLAFLKCLAAVWKRSKPLCPIPNRSRKHAPGAAVLQGSKGRGPCWSNFRRWSRPAP